MRQVELNPKGDYTNWECEKIDELLQDQYPYQLGTLVMENENFRLWELELFPMERLSFRKQPSNYSWSCVTGGTVIFTNGNGKIDLLFFKKDDYGFINNAGKLIVSDLENNGRSVIRFHIYEYRNLIALI